MAASLFAFAVERAEAAERMVDLFRSGHQVLHTEGYISFDGCEWDKVYKLGPYLFICRSYEYHYQYGKAEILIRVFEHQGQRIASTYLCVSEETCVRGDLRRL